jgi:hypothetical protein
MFICDKSKKMNKKIDFTLFTAMITFTHLTIFEKIFTIQD